MRHRNVNTPLPENLRDSMHAEPAPVRLQDLFLILPQCVDLWLLAITAAFRASRDNVLRSRPRRRPRMGHVECCAKWNCIHVSGWGRWTRYSAADLRLLGSVNASQRGFFLSLVALGSGMQPVAQRGHEIKKNSLHRTSIMSPSSAMTTRIRRQQLTMSFIDRENMSAVVQSARLCQRKHCHISSHQLNRGEYRSGFCH